MKKGFTMLEVIFCIMLLSIIIVPLYGLNAMSHRTNALSNSKDMEFNIARSLCERFKNERGTIQRKVNLLFVNNSDELPFDITSFINFSIDTNIDELEMNMDFLHYSNLSSKKYAVVLSSFYTENMCFLKVKVIGMLKNASSVTLKIARCGA